MTRRVWKPLPSNTNHLVPVKDIMIGQIYGKLTALEKLERRDTAGHFIRCRCECGNEIEISGALLKSDRVNNCGCDRRKGNKHTAARAEPIEIGKTYGLLTVQEYLGTPYGPKIYRCTCNCGKVYVSPGYELRRGNVARNCCREAPKERWKITARCRYRKNYSDGDISFEEFLILSQQNCFYCNSPPANYAGVHRYRDPDIAKQYEWAYNGLDRVDNSKGHAKENCVPCCEPCNKAKLKMSYDEFMNLIKKIYHHRAKQTEQASIL